LAPRSARIGGAGPGRRRAWLGKISGLAGIARDVGRADPVDEVAQPIGEEAQGVDPRVGRIARGEPRGFGPVGIADMFKAQKGAQTDKAAAYRTAQMRSFGEIGDQRDAIARCRLAAEQTRCVCQRRRMFGDEAPDGRKTSVCDGRCGLELVPE